MEHINKPFGIEEQRVLCFTMPKTAFFGYANLRKGGSMGIV